MEIVDIVDEKGNILYQTSKVESHEKGLLHKCVIAEVVNSKGDILLIKPYSYKQDAGQYVSPVGGHVRAGEKEEDALKREVDEEIGIKHFDATFKGKAIFNRKVLGRHENHYFFVYEIHTDEEPVLGDEAEFLTWFTQSELKEKIKNNKELFGDAYFAVVNNFYPELIKK